MRDGVTIACDLRRPARDGVPVDGPFPGIVVEFTPYVVLRDFYLGEADFFASRGYVALVPSSAAWAPRAASGTTAASASAAGTPTT